MFTEESFENVVIEYLKELNYDYIHGSNLTRDNKEVLLLENLKTNLININKEIPESSIDYAIKKNTKLWNKRRIYKQQTIPQISYRRNRNHRLHKWKNSISHSKTNRLWQYQKQRISSSQPTRNSRRRY